VNLAEHYWDLKEPLRWAEVTCAGSKSEIKSNRTIEVDNKQRLIADKMANRAIIKRYLNKRVTESQLWNHGSASTINEPVKGKEG